MYIYHRIVVRNARRLPDGNAPSFTVNFEKSQPLRFVRVPGVFRTWASLELSSTSLVHSPVGRCPNTKTKQRVGQSHDDGSASTRAYQPAAGEEIHKGGRGSPHMIAGRSSTDRRRRCRNSMGDSATLRQPLCFRDDAGNDFLIVACRARSCVAISHPKKAIALADLFGEEKEGVTASLRWMDIARFSDSLVVQCCISRTLLLY